MKKLLLVLVALLGLYGVSPYLAVGLLLHAANQADEAALASRVDFESVRSSLRQQFEARMVKPGETLDPMQGMMLNTMIGGFASPRGVAMLLRNRGQMTAPPTPPSDGTVTTGDGSPSKPSLGMSDLDLDWFFFTGPARFEAQARGGALVLEPRGAWWRLVDVRLPPRDRGAPVPAPVVAESEPRSPTEPASAPELLPLEP